MKAQRPLVKTQGGSQMYAILLALRQSQQRASCGLSIRKFTHDSSTMSAKSGIEQRQAPVEQETTVRKRTKGASCRIDRQEAHANN